MEDPNAAYCRCRGPDDGSQMVGCDNEDACPNSGWAHWDCIVTKQPMPDDEQSWLCPDCDATKKRRKKGGVLYSWTKSAIAKGAAAKRSATTGKNGKKGGSKANVRGLIN